MRGREVRRVEWVGLLGGREWGIVRDSGGGEGVDDRVGGRKIRRNRGWIVEVLDRVEVLFGI